MLGGEEEWIVYRVAYVVKCARKSSWEHYVRLHPEMLEAMKEIIVVDNLTREQAEQFVSLTKED